MKTLCIITKVAVYEPGVVVLTILGDDTPDDNYENTDHFSAFSCVIDEQVLSVEGSLLPAQDVQEGMHIWLEEHELITSVEQVKGS
jgi:hypothetical protein